MTRIHFYASEVDNYKLREFIDSLGLYVYPTNLERVGKTETVAKDIFHGYISFLESSKLHTFGNHQITHVNDPLVMWVPSYIIEYNGDKYIIHGSLEYEFQNPSREEEVKYGKSIFGKLSRWIRKNWPPPVKRDYCRGIEAQKLIQFEGYLPRGVPPNAQVEYVKSET